LKRIGQSLRRWIGILGVATALGLLAGSQALRVQTATAGPVAQQNPGTIAIRKQVVDASGNVVADASGFRFGFGRLSMGTVLSPDFGPATTVAGSTSSTLTPGTFRLFEQARTGCTVRDVTIGGVLFSGPTLRVTEVESTVEFTVNAGQTVTIDVRNTCSAAAGMGMMAAGPTRTDQLFPGCNNLALTFPAGTPLRTVAQGVSAPAGLQSIFRLNNQTGRFAGFSPTVPEFANDYTMVTARLETVFICVRAAGTLTQPEI
jgi:hypothetical protein